MAFDAYTVAVKLSLINGVSAGLAQIASQFQTLNGHITQSMTKLSLMEQQLMRFKAMGAVGGVSAAAGALGLYAFKGPYEEAKRLAQAEANFGTLNLSIADNASAFAKAAAMSHDILGTSITDNVKSIHDLHTAFGDLHHAMRTADDFAKFSFIAKVMNDGAPVEGLVYNAAKALEHRGGRIMNDDSTFKHELDFMERVYLGSRGKVGPSEFFHASQTGKLAYTLMSEDELFGPFAAYMQAKSGATAGTAQMTFVSSLVGGHMTSKAKGFLADLGLWDEGVSSARVKMFADMTRGMTAEERKAMGFITPSAGGLKSQYLDEAVQHTSRFVQEVLTPLVRKKYGANLSDDAIAEIYMANFNRSTSDVMGEYVVNAQKFRKDAAIFNNSMGIGAAYQHYLRSPEGAEIAAGEAWKNLLTVIGSVYLPVITKGLLGFASMLDRIGQFMDNHKTMTDVIVSSVAALSGLAVLGGGVLMTAAAIGTLKLAIGVTAGSGLIGSLTSAATAAGTLSGSGGLVLLAARFGLVGVAVGSILALIASALPNDNGDHKGMHPVRVGNGKNSPWVWVPDDVPSTPSTPSAVVNHRQTLVHGTTVRTAPMAQANQTVVLKVGERELARAVVPTLAKEMSRPTMGAMVDPTMNLRPVAGASGH